MRRAVVAAEESNNINREALEAVQRAFITFKTIDQNRMKHPNGYFWNLSVVWDNSGNTPAVGAVSVEDIKQLSSVPTEDQFHDGAKPSDFIKMTIGPKIDTATSTLYRADTLFFGKELGNLETIPPSTPPPPVAENVFFWGWTMYRDEFPHTEAHLTEFCLRVVGAERSSNGKMVRLDFTTTKEHNCTDQYCPDYKAMVALYPE